MVTQPKAVAVFDFKDLGIWSSVSVFETNSKGTIYFQLCFVLCFSSRENPLLGMLTEVRLNLGTRNRKSKEIQLKVWKKWNKGKRKICHRSFTLDKSAGLDRKTTEGSKTAKNILFFWTSVHFLTRRVGWLRGLWFWCVWRFYQLWPHNNSIFQISQKNQVYSPSTKPNCTDFFPKQNQIEIVLLKNPN